MADVSYITASGVIQPDTATIRADVETAFKAAFGEDLVTTSDTVQGALIDALTEARDTTIRLMVATANQINPSISGGVFLDAIAALSGKARTAATRTTVNATITGVAGTVIPSGSQARTAAGDSFTTLGAVTIPPVGEASITFSAVETGPVPCPAGALTEIASPVLGWEAVTNATAGTVGVLTQSDAAFRRDRRLTLAKQGQSTPAAVLSGLFDLPGVRSAVFRENYNDTTEEIDGITIPAHHIWTCVEGATDEEVAAAILSDKPGGIGTHGATVVSVTEPASGQAYTVRFDRPAPVPCFATIYVRNLNPLAPPEALVRAAVLAWAGGEIDGQDGLLIGVDLSPWQLAAVVAEQVPSVVVTAVEVAKDGDPLGSASVPIALNEIAVLTAASVRVELL